MDIGYIGNFRAKYSTENDRAWAFNKLGHNVIAFQEDTCCTEDILSHKLDFLIYSHTHGWHMPEILKLFKSIGVPTISIHLDRWAQLAREKDVGVEATWKVDHMFMADGSPEAVELYEKHNLNWTFLKPGVDERGCYMAQPDPVRFPHKIVFTGSKGYHSEYPFRPKLIEWLHKTYPNQFTHYGDDLPSLRGHDLNVLYASAKIVVGDSCFGGRPNYVSDRYFEVRGRGGFLLHPHTKGFNTTGVGHYKTLEELQKQIDFYLTNDYSRELMRKKGFEYVKNNHTYTHRAKEVLNIISKGLI